MASPIDPLLELGALFGRVAGTDPVAALLLVLGAVLTAGISAVAALLALGAGLDTADRMLSRTPNRRPPRR